MSRSTSRTRSEERPLFEPQVGINAYTAENLDKFIAQAGRQYTDLVNQRMIALREDYRRRGIALTSKEYRQEAKQIRWDVLMDLYENHPELIRRLAPRAEATKTITAEEVEKLFNKDGMRAVLGLVQDNKAVDFNLNALKEAAKVLGVTKTSVVTKGLKGEDSKEALYKYILSQTPQILEREAIQREEQQAFGNVYTIERLNAMSEQELRDILRGMGLDTTGSRVALVKRILSNQARPTTIPKYSESYLKSLKVDALRNLAKNLNIPSSGRKDDLIARILDAQGGAAAEAGGVNVTEELARLRDIANTEGVMAARRAARDISPETYEKATVVQLKNLTKLLALEVQRAGTTATKDELIRAITGRVPTSAASRERRRALQADTALCEESTDEEVREAAKELGIDTRGMSKADICRAIYEAYLYRFSSLVLDQLGPGSERTLAQLAQLPPLRRTTAIKDIARRAKFTNVTTLADLMREFLLSHYRTRALRYAPDVVNLVSDFLLNGDVPNDLRDLDDMVKVFADINPNLLTLDSSQEQMAGLTEFYNTLVQPVMSNSAAAVDILQGAFARFSYATPTRRRAGPLSRQRVEQPAPAPILEEEIPEEEEEEEEIPV